MNMRQLDYSNIESTPVWNEVKNWSDDEKSALFVNEIPHEVLAASVEMALKDHENGNAISHADFMNRIKEDREWK